MLGPLHTNAISISRSKYISFILATYLICISISLGEEKVNHVVRQARQKIDNKPAFQVVHSDNLRVRDDFSGWPHISGMKVNHNIP